MEMARRNFNPIFFEVLKTVFLLNCYAKISSAYSLKNRPMGSILFFAPFLQKKAFLLVYMAGLVVFTLLLVVFLS